MKRTVLPICLFAITTVATTAGTICPGASTGTNFNHPPDPTRTGCNTLITIAQTSSGASAVVTTPDTEPYDDSEDNLVGVLNNSSISISSLTLTGSDIFGLDGDGVCTFTFPGNSYCSASQRAGIDPQDYFGPTSTFVITNVNMGVVNFAPSIAPGGSTYFSLEEPPSASLQVVVGRVPEPGTITLFGTGISGIVLGLWRRRRR